MVRSMYNGGAYYYAASKELQVSPDRVAWAHDTGVKSNSDKRDVPISYSSLGVWYQIRRDLRNYVPMEVTDVRFQAASESGLWYPRRNALRYGSERLARNDP